MSDSLTLYKMILLYTLSRVDFTLSNAQLCDFLLEKNYTDYFTIQQAISELVDSKLIVVESVNNTSFYRITEEGSMTLEYFGNRVSTGTKEDIDAYLKANRMKLRSESDVVAVCYETSTGEYAAHCQVRDGKNSVIELTLTVPAEEQAAAICANWKQKNQAIYAYLMDELL